MADTAHSLQFWSAAVFWFVAINVVVSLVFVLVVMVGGCFDLRYLLKALREEPVDLCDDGRVQDPESDTPQKGEDSVTSERESHSPATTRGS